MAEGNSSRKMKSILTLLLLMRLLHEHESLPLGMGSNGLIKPHSTFPILSPSVHTAMFEAPVPFPDKSLHNSAETPAASPASELKSPLESFWNSFRHMISGVFHHRDTDKDETEEDNEEGTGERQSRAGEEDHDAQQGATEPSLRVPKDSLLGSTKVRTVNTTEETERRKNENSNAPYGGEVEKSDAVTSGLQAWVKDITSVIRDLQVWMDMQNKQKVYTIVSANETTLVARIANRMFAPELDKSTPEDVTEARPLRVDARRGFTIVYVNETHENGTEQMKYHIHTGNRTAYHDKILLRRVHKTKPRKGYDIIIPLNCEQNTSRARTEESKNVSNQVGGLNSTVREAAEEWSAHTEEDRTEFLHMQMKCQKKYGNSGVKRMLCTCESLHRHHAGKRLLCISRIADKVVRTSSEVGVSRLGAEIYEGAVMCKKSSKGIVEGEICLKKLLEEVAGEKSNFHLVHGRSILNMLDGEAMRSVDAALADGIDDDDASEGGDEDVAVPFLTVALQWVLYTSYCIGVVLLLVCVVDVLRQISRHRSRVSRTPEFTHLPAWMQRIRSSLTSPSRLYNRNFSS